MTHPIQDPGSNQKAEPASQLAGLKPSTVKGRRPAAPVAFVEFISHSVSQTQKAAASLTQFLQAGDILLLVGDLGAGKTTFTKGIALGLGVQGYVNSPTFTLVNEYQGRCPVYHLDCYRLNSFQEALDFGIEEYLYGDGVTLIEWPERIHEILPQEFMTVRLNYLSDTKRALRFEPTGDRYITMLQDFKRKSFGGPQ